MALNMKRASKISHTASTFASGGIYRLPSVARTGKCARRCQVKVRAEADPLPRVPVPPPEGVTMPPKEPRAPPAWFGFVENAERINSRAAMIGFFGILAVELIFGKGILELMGLTVGNGLGFEF